MKLDKSRTLEANYLKATVGWNEALRNRRIERKSRAKLLYGSHAMMSALNEKIPGYRKVADNMRRMQLVVK